MGSNSANMVTGIVANNSCDYIAKVFQHLNSGGCFASISKGQEIEKLPLDFADIIETEATGGWYEGEHYESFSKSQTGQIAFTSGTEGAAKCIKISHSALANSTERIASVMELNEEIREYVGIPVYHSFGFGRCRAISAVNGRFYIPHDGFSLKEILGLLKEGSINAISAVPSLWRILINQSDLFAQQGKKIRWIEIGSQYMSSEEKRALKKIFPNAKIVQHYGLTEASRTTFLKIHETEGRALESVGKPLYGVDVNINQEGLIIIRGPHVSDSIITRDGEVGLTDSEGWLTTSDAGHFEEGYLYFDGRRDDQINCGGIKIIPEQVEAKVKRMIQLVDGWAIVGVPDPLRGEVPVLVLDSSKKAKEDELREGVLAVFQEMNLNIGDLLKTYSMETLPATSTGKIKRKEIVQTLVALANEEKKNEPWYTQLFARFIGGKQAKTVRDVFKNQFPHQDIDAEATFVDLGGDSLSYLSTAIDLERVLPDLPTNWQKMPVRELEKLSKPGKSLFTSIDSLIVLRALSIMLIVMGHFGFLNYGGGGAYTLFFIAGMTFATFTVPKVISDESILPALLLILRVTVLTVFFFIVNFAMTGYGELPAALMFSNWIGPHVEGGAWFIEVYIQMLVIIILILMVPWCRNMLNHKPFVSSIVFTSILLCVSLLSDYFIDTHHLFRRLPHLFAWVFLCGMSLHYSKKVIHRLLVSGVFAVGWVVFFGASEYYYGLTGLLLIWVPTLPIPRIITWGTREIANASLVIYLTHFQFASISEKLIGQNSGSKVIFALVGGVIIWKFYTRIDAFLCDRFYTLTMVNKRELIDV